VCRPVVSVCAESFAKDMARRHDNRSSTQVTTNKTVKMR
jgi:hypothetical protein